MFTFFFFQLFFNFSTTWKLNLGLSNFQSQYGLLSCIKYGYKVKIMISIYIYQCLSIKIRKNWDKLQTQFLDVGSSAIIFAKKKIYCPKSQFRSKWSHAMSKEFWLLNTLIKVSLMHFQSICWVFFYENWYNPEISPLAMVPQPINFIDFIFHSNFFKFFQIFLLAENRIWVWVTFHSK